MRRVALLVADHDPVADLDRALDEQDEPGDEVVDDRLQAEADANRERTRHDGEVRHVEAGVETDSGAATPMPA